MARRTTKTGKALERQVADAYRAMGARKVEHDVELAGHQIDVYVEMETADRALHRVAVEAKDHTRPVGVKIVADFAAVVDGLRRLNLVDEGVIVSTVGFSKQARNAARLSGLRLLEPADLDAMQEGRDTATGALAHVPSTGPAVYLPGDRALLEHASGSPFVVGRPLRASEPIFGRQAAFRFIAGQLAKFSSVNVIGERRMGRTSLLNHLVGRRDEYLIPQPDQPPLVLACVDLQAGVSTAVRFYGLALRTLLDHLPPSQDAEARRFQDWRERLYARPEAGYDEFERVLKHLRDSFGVCVRPVLIVDEFEHLLAPEVKEGFPFPDFFNGVRALIGAELLAMVITSRRSLADYFRDPIQPDTLTSTFPSYFTPFTLSLLDDAAADALLLQPSDHTLTLKEASEAKRWAGGHPCYLQVAGQDWYEAKAGGRTPRWARRRFAELKRQSCMVGHAATVKTSLWPGRLRRTLRAIFRDVPIRIGRLAQGLGARFDDVAAWIIGAATIILILLVLLGVAGGGDLLDVIRKGLGL
jgi:hypothetical protein